MKLQDGQIIEIATNTHKIKFRVIKQKINTCEKCEADNYCNVIYNRFATEKRVGCQNIIFKKTEKN
jgi:hypothetical protein